MKPDSIAQSKCCPVAEDRMYVGKGQDVRVDARHRKARYRGIGYSYKLKVK